MTGIVDEALKQDGDDSLNIGNYIKALLSFIENTATPMTIGIQGEWGSGKTSLLNQIWNGLEKRDSENQDLRYKQIWINAWEHSLLCSPEECLIKIINEIISELVAADTQKTKAEKLTSGINKLAKGAARIGGAVALGMAGKDIADDIFDQHENSIKQLRQDLKKLTNEIKGLETNPFDKFIIYVDDLDRIDPPDAVRILELLKNIFNLEDCIFLLAIDYQVVVKGLEAKFGKQTPENEWEFRAYFDKIIQLPFKMPMSNYDIGNYVLELLSTIDFYSGDEELDEELIKNFVELSITGNPRSIKRLINSLSLIKLFNSLSDDLDSNFLKDKNGATIMFAMVCLQTAHPDIYDLLSQNPDFQKWDDELAYKVTQGKEKLEENYELNYNQATKQGEDFDEEWEKILFKVCYLNPRSRAKATNISRFLTILIDEFKADKNSEELTNLISNALGQSAITSVTTTENPNIRPAKGSYKPFYNEGFDDWLDRKIEDISIRAKKSKEEFSIPVEVFEKLKSFVDILKNDFGACDANENPDNDLTLHYSGNLTLKYKGKKTFSFWVGTSNPENKKRSRKGVAGGDLNDPQSWVMSSEISKNPKFENKPLFIEELNIKFNQYKPGYRVKSINPREIVLPGAGAPDIAHMGVIPILDYPHDYFKFLVETSIDARKNHKDELFNRSKMKEIEDIFFKADEDSAEFKKAHDFIQNWNADENVFTIKDYKKGV